VIDRTELMGHAERMVAVRDALARIELEIFAAEREFEQSMAELRGQRDKLRSDYADLLKAELERVDGKAGVKSRARALPRNLTGLPDRATILAVLQSAGGTLTTAQIRELAGVPRSVPFNAMSRLMKTLVDDGRVIREGRARGTRYRLRHDRDHRADQPRGGSVAGDSVGRAVQRRNVDVARVLLSEG
jgi:hypothetical protein